MFSPSPSGSTVRVPPRGIVCPAIISMLSRQLDPILRQQRVGQVPDELGLVILDTYDIFHRRSSVAPFRQSNWRRCNLFPSGVAVSSGHRTALDDGLPVPRLPSSSANAHGSHSPKFVSGPLTIDLKSASIRFSEGYPFDLRSCICARPTAGLLLVTAACRYHPRIPYRISR